MKMATNTTLAHVTGLEQPLRLYSLGTAANTLYYLHAPEQAELAAPSGCPARSATAPAGDGQGRQDDTSYLSTPQAFLIPRNSSRECILIPSVFTRIGPTLVSL